MLNFVAINLFDNNLVSVKIPHCISFLILSVIDSMALIWLYQEAQQERTTFVSSLLSLLAEYSLQPPVPDAQSIVSNVKVSL